MGATGWDDGRRWPVDPVRWHPAVAAWTDEPDGTWEPLWRGAFGTLRLRRVATGATVTIHPARGWVFPSTDPAAAGVLGPDDLDVFDVDDRPLYLRARERLGPVDADTVYAFTPPLGAGGPPRLDALRIEAAVAHVVHLAAVTTRTTFPDVTR